MTSKAQEVDTARLRELLAGVPQGIWSFVGKSKNRFVIFSGEGEPPNVINKHTIALDVSDEAHAMLITEAINNLEALLDAAEGRGLVVTDEMVEASRVAARREAERLSVVGAAYTHRAKEDAIISAVLTAALPHLRTVDQVERDVVERLAKQAELQANYSQPTAQAFKGWTPQHQKDADGAARWLRSQSPTDEGSNT